MPGCQAQGGEGSWRRAGPTCAPRQPAFSRAPSLLGRVPPGHEEVGAERGAVCRAGRWVGLPVGSGGWGEPLGRPSCQPGVATAPRKRPLLLPCCLDALAPRSPPGLCWAPEGSALAALACLSGLSTSPAGGSTVKPTWDSCALTKGLCGGQVQWASLCPDCLVCLTCHQVPRTQPEHRALDP